MLWVLLSVHPFTAEVVGLHVGPHAAESEGCSCNVHFCPKLQLQVRVLLSSCALFPSRTPVKHLTERNGETSTPHGFRASQLCPNRHCGGETQWNGTFQRLRFDSTAAVKAGQSSMPMYHQTWRAQSTDKVNIEALDQPSLRHVLLAKGCLMGGALR